MRRSEVQESDGHLTHGTVDGYYNHGCRCSACCEVGREYMRQRRARAAGYKPTKAEAT